MKLCSEKKVPESHTVPDSAERARFSDYAVGIFPLLNSRKSVKKEIKRGSLFLDGRSATTGSWVSPGSTIEFIRQPAARPVYELSLETAYEDDHIAVIIKPAGIPVNGNRFKTIENALPFTLRPSTEKDALPRPMPLHRLDSRTSGLLLAAKTASAMKDLGIQFEKRVLKKRYRAVITGKLKGNGAINNPVEDREALTLYSSVRVTPSAKNGYLTLVDLFPETGRTHQLRIHLAGIDHPVLGDTLYGSEGSILKGRGLFLCAVELSFLHPFFRTPLSISITHPVKFDSIMRREKLRYREG